MTDEKTIGKCVTKYGETEYEQNPDTDDVQWRNITDLELFCKVIFISLKETGDIAATEEDFFEIEKILKENFLKEVAFKEYIIVKCLPGLEKFQADPFPIRLYWIAVMAENQWYALIKSFISLYYCYLLYQDSEDGREMIIEIHENLDKNWMDKISLVYERFARGTNGGRHALKTGCKNIDIYMKNALRETPKVFHRMAG